MTLTSSDLPGGTTLRVLVCAPQARFVPIFGRFVVPGLAISRNGNTFERVPNAEAFYQFDSLTNVGYYCGYVEEEVNTETVVVAPARLLDTDTTFSVVEQVFLFLFGIMYLAFTVYAVILLVH